MFPKEDKAPLSWFTYLIFGLLMVFAGTVGAFNGIAEIVVQENVSLTLKVLFSSVFLTGLAFSLVVLFSAELPVMCLFIAVISWFVVGFSGFFSEQDEFVFQSPIFFWIGVYSLTRIPVSIKQARVRKKDDLW